MNVIRYPTPDEAIRCRAELEQVVHAAQRDEPPEKTALAWPAGLDRQLLHGLPVQNRTRLCLLRGKVACGEGAYTVEQLLRVRYLTPAGLREVVLATEAFLADYINAFDEPPGAADVAAMRLRRAVERLTPTETAIVEQRLLADPPVAYRALVLRLELSATRIRSRLREARRRFKVALGPELHIIAAQLKEDLGPSPSEEEVAERIDALLDGVLPDHGGGSGPRARALFRQALANELI